VLTELPYPLLDLLGLLLDLERVEAHQNSLEVREEGGRRDDDHLIFARGPLEQVLLLRRSDLVGEEVVVDPSEGINIKAKSIVFSSGRMYLAVSTMRFLRSFTNAFSIARLIAGSHLMRRL
jgi:hypothetical protein